MQHRILILLNERVCLGLYGPLPFCPIYFLTLTFMHRCYHFFHSVSSCLLSLNLCSQSLYQYLSLCLSLPINLTIPLSLSSLISFLVLSHSQSLLFHPSLLGIQRWYPCGYRERLFIQIFLTS